MKKVTTWYPDTCKCQLQYEWDTDNPQADPVPVAATPCPLHAHHGEHPYVYAAVLKENQGKNLAMGELVEQSEGDIAHEDIHWSFDERRQLVLSIPKLANRKKKTAQRVLDERFGAGKVVLE